MPVPPYIVFDRNSVTPFYRQIYENYRDAILSGRLRPGQRLPSTRSLAMELGISRLPAVNAFEQLLHEGYIEGKIGAGTYVKDTIPTELARGRRKALALVSNLPKNENILGPFRVSLPALDHFPVQVWSRLVSRHTKNPAIEHMAYADPAGHAPLREAIAQYLRTARAVRCETEQILIVSGSQLALQICAKALLQRADSVCIEEPGYPGARDALRSTGAILVPVPVDQEGIQVHALPKHASAVYVTPSHQYPLGVSMTASRRLALLEWAQRADAWIIEDDYDSEYRFTSRPLAALQGMDLESRVIYIGTFSKVLFPSLRLGYIVMPPSLANIFVQLRESFDIFSPTLYQLVLTDFIQQGHFARHLRRMRSIYQSRRNALISAINKHLKKFLEPYNSDAGLHLVAFLNDDLDDREIVQRAAEEGISASALSSCYISKNSRNGLILGFGGATEKQIALAARNLANIFRRL